MENYIVSARKYRPMTFGSVVGQTALTTTLKHAIAAGRLAHAYLFCGPRGVGKTTCARIFAKTINCLALTPEGEACGECESCRAFNEGRSYNIHELDAASNNSVDDMRQLIEQVTIPPQIGRYKVFIIDEVHMLSTAAFNAFLKTLEEPPAHVIFILATTEKHKILPTILSRCQIYDFNRMGENDIVGHLREVARRENISVEEEALGVIAQKADGGMRDALSIFDQVASYAEGEITYQKVIDDLGVLDYDYYFRMTDALLKPDIPAALLTLGEVLARGFDGGLFMGGLAAHLRNLLVSRDAQTLPLLDVAQSIRERYREQAGRCSERFLYRALRRCAACDIHYRTAGNKRLLVELTLIEVAQGDDDEDGCGRRPTKKLKPLFSAAVPAAPASPAPAAQVQTKVTASASSAPTVTPPAPPTSPAPVVRASRMISIRRPSASTSNTTTDTPAATESPVSVTKQEKPFTAVELNTCWLRFAAELPREQTAMATRMKGMTPELDDDRHVVVAVENQQVVTYMEALRADLVAYLRRELCNDNVDVTFRLPEPGEQRRIYSKKELYAAMLEKSPSLRLLASELQLELN